MKQNKNLKGTIFALVAVVLLVIVMVLAYNQFKPKPIEGAKEVTVEVIVPDEEKKEFTLHTDAQYLRQALEEADLIKGTESEFGLFISEVNGHVANEANQEWWCITKGGQQVNNGVDTIAIADGDHYEITLTTGY